VLERVCWRRTTYLLVLGIGGVRGGGVVLLRDDCTEVR